MNTAITDKGRNMRSVGRLVLNGQGPLMLLFLAMLAANNAWAALPAPITPDSGTPAAGDFIDYFKWSVKDILLIGGLVISTVSFLIVSISAFMKFNEARRDRAEWGEVFTLVGVGAFLLVATGFLLNQTLTIIS